MSNLLDTVQTMLDVNTVAAKLGCSTRHVYRMADAGLMPAKVKIGGLVRWNAEEINEWVNAGCPRCKERAA